MSANPPGLMVTPYISFEGATETRRKHPKGVQPPLFERLTAVYPDTSNHLPTTPYPSYSFPADASIPSTPARSRVEGDIFTIAAAGSGYSSTDGTITGGGGTGATIELVVDGSGGITGVVVTNSGTGYTSAPSVSLAGGAGGSITVSNWALNDYTAWFEIGAYVVLLGATSHTRRVRWSAPGDDTYWDRYRLDQGIEVLSGAGYMDLPGTGALSQGVSLGSLGALFDAEGIGVLALTGDWEVPFSYAKILNGEIAKSDARYLDGNAVFVGIDGRVWYTNGYSANPMDGPLDINTISEITWPPAATADFAHNTATDHFVFQSPPTTGTILYIDRYTGAYGTSGATKYAQTGVLQILPEDHRVHIQRVRLHWGVTGTFSGSCTMTVGCKGLTEASWHTSSATSLATGGGTVETDFEVNYVAALPQLKFTVTTQSGATVTLYGMTIIYGDGGLR